MIDKGLTLADFDRQLADRLKEIYSRDGYVSKAEIRALAPTRSVSDLTKRLHEYGLIDFEIIGADDKARILANEKLMAAYREGGSRPMTREAIAQIIGVKHRSVTGALARMKNQGLPIPLVMKQPKKTYTPPSSSPMGLPVPLRGKDPKGLVRVGGREGVPARYMGLYNGKARYQIY